MERGSWFGRATIAILVLSGCAGCQREAPSDQAQPVQPNSTVERAVRQSVDAIQSPMDKAKSVEGTLDRAAERQAETVGAMGQ